MGAAREEPEGRIAGRGFGLRVCFICIHGGSSRRFSGRHHRLRRNSSRTSRPPRLFSCCRPLAYYREATLRLGSCPGGTPQEISRGQVRVSGRSPRLTRCRASMPQRGIEEIFATDCHAASRGPSVASATTAEKNAHPRPPSSRQVPGHFLRCPAGARSNIPTLPGASPAAADLPPANLRWRPSGTGSAPRSSRGRPSVRMPRRCGAGFQPAGSGGILPPVSATGLRCGGTGNTGQGCPVNRQAGMPAPRACLVRRRRPLLSPRIALASGRSLILEGWGIAPGASRGRKVRTPQGAMPRNRGP